MKRFSALRHRPAGFVFQPFQMVALLFVLLISATCVAQQTPFLSPEGVKRLADLDFESLNTKDGLPHQSVYGFTQDSTGYVWIATYGGLSRFDGYKLRTYTHDAAQRTSLHDNNVRVLLPADHGDLWIGSDTGGVFYYRAATDTFEDLPNLPPALRGVRVYCMIADGHGGIWVGGQFGLAHYDPAKQAYEVFSSFEDHGDRSSSPGASHFPLKRVFSLFLDADGTLWVGGDPGLLMRRPGSSQFERVPGVEGDHEVGATPFVWAFFRDRAGRLWVGCDHVGVATYDPATRTLRGVPGLSGAASEIGEHTVRGFIEHERGQLWIATYGGGLVTYDSGSGFIRSFIKGMQTPAPLKNNFLRGIFRDRSGVIWIATDDGVAKVADVTSGIFQIHPSLMFPEKLAGTEVRSVGVVQGQIWIGFDQGEFGPLDAEGRVKKIAPAPGLASALLSKREILAIKGVDANTAYAAGTGLFRVDLKTRTYTPSLDPLISQEVVGTLCVEGDNLWAGTYNGLYQYNLRTGKSHMYRHDPNDPQSLSENDIREILRSHDGRLWISTRAGLNQFDPASGKFRSFRHVAGDPSSLPADNVRSLMEDSQGRLWVATTGTGIAVLVGHDAKDKPLFRTVNTRSGLPSDAIFTLVPGKDGRIWANTAAGLSVIQPTNFAVQTYSAGDGFRSTSQKLFGSVALTDGTLLFRGADGLIAVQPEQIEQKSYRAPLVMTELESNGDERLPIPFAYTAMHGPISLQAHHRGFSAQFALLDYNAPELATYSYRLSRVDKDWVQLPNGIHSISYSDLPPGKFTLSVRALGRSGVGTATELSFEIVAHRAWSESRAFRTALVLLGILLVYLLIRSRTSFLEHRREQLEALIAERTTELEKANSLLNQLATRDSLTNLYNRRYFLELAEKELLRIRRSGRTLSMLLMDIDHFKAVNDSYGHFVGDAVIRMVSDGISNTVRTTDTVARFGGEEYIVLLPETTVVQAEQLAERVRAAVSEARYESANGTISTTVSIGCAEVNPSAPLAELLERADKALYAAKAAGRDCIRSA